jgi:hypothetical protein
MPKQPNAPDGDGAAPDGDQGVESKPVKIERPERSADAAAAAAEKQDVVHRSHLEKVISERDRAKQTARSLQQMVEELQEAAGGKDITPDDVRQLMAFKAEQEAAERAALEKKGEFDQILQKERREHEQAISSERKRQEEIMSHLREEKLGRLSTDILIKTGVADHAAEAARDRMMRVGADNIRLELVLENGTYSPQLRDTAGVWPSNGKDGSPMTLEEFAEKFKEQNPFFYKAEVTAGAGNIGSGGQQANVGGNPATIERAIGHQDMAAFIAATGRDIKNYQ